MRVYFYICLTLTIALFGGSSFAGELSTGDFAFFENKVRPLLIENSYGCHSHEEKIKGGLALDSRAGWMAGGDSGTVILPGQPEESLLITAVTYVYPDSEMPPKQKLPDAEIEILREWIARYRHAGRDFRLTDVYGEVVKEILV